jgi:hypothetical protein
MWGRKSEPLEASRRGEQRRHCLERMAAQGLPLWSNAPEHCDRCDRELLVGEQAVIMSSGEALLLACPLCAPVLRDEGYRVVAPDANGPLDSRLSDSQ